jgi:hypothetical protein
VGLFAGSVPPTVTEDACQGGGENDEEKDDEYNSDDFHGSILLRSTIRQQWQK